MHAGKENIINKIESEVFEIAFNTEGSRVQQVFQNQPESYFASGPWSRGGGERGGEAEKRRMSLQSILEFEGF